MSNAELIERARELRMLGELANALADAERERDEYMERFRNVSDANSDILDQLWAAQAVIAEAKRSLDYGGERHYLERIYATQNALSQSPTDALQAHDRQVAAKALTDAARLARSYDANHVADILDERAVSLVPGNPEPTDQTGTNR